MDRVFRFVCLLLLPTMMLLATVGPVAAAADLLPDLAMARLRDIKIETTSDGRRLLRYTTVAVNIGPGAIEVRGKRANTSSTMTVEQRIFDDAGGSRYTPTTATMFYAGDGHTHWHIRDFERYVLDRLDNGSRVGTGLKSGFCLYDIEAFGSPNDATYTSISNCGGGSSALETRMGISSGWGDRYKSSLPDQYIDITNLPAGQYRLIGTADPSNSFLETDDSNNSIWVDLQITGSGVIVQTYGPSALPLGNNQLMNRRFEIDANNDTRPDYWTTDNRITRGNQVVQEGSYAGKISANDDSSFYIEQTAYDIFEGRSYAYSGWVNIPSTNDSFSLKLQVKWRDISSATISTSTIKTFTDDTNGGWQFVSGTAVAPPGAISAKVRLNIASLKATIYADNFLFGPQ